MKKTKRPSPRNKHRSFNAAITKAKQEGNEVQLVSYEISFEPMKQTDPIPRPVQDQLDELYDLLHDNPRAAIPRLLELKEHYPKTPVIYNYLTVAYSRIGNREATRQLAKENYLANPQYLFARVNYAQVCIADKNWEVIPEIFDGKFDLKMLYPKRKRFHVTEFNGFTAVMCAYFSLTGNDETALMLYESMKEIDPDSDMIRFAQTFVMPSLLQRLSQWGVKKSREVEQELVKREQARSADSEFDA